MGSEIPTGDGKLANLFLRCTYMSRVLKPSFHEYTILLRLLGIITLRVLRLEVSVYNVNISNQCQTTFARVGVGGVKSVSRGVCK